MRRRKRGFSLLSSGGDDDHRGSGRLTPEQIATNIEYGLQTMLKSWQDSLRLVGEKDDVFMMRRVAIVLKERGYRQIFEILEGFPVLKVWRKTDNAS